MSLVLLDPEDSIVGRALADTEAQGAFEEYETAFDEYESERDGIVDEADGLIGDMPE